MLKLIDLFSGAGGMTLGFVDKRFCGGFHPVLALDSDTLAIASHNQNFSGSSICDKLETWIEKDQVPRADVVIGGPPCQGFSLLNKNKNEDHRRALWEPFLDVVCKARASVFVMENVAAFSRSPELRKVLNQAHDMKYNTYTDVLNAADFGVPQHRRRTFIVGVSQSICKPYVPPQPSHGLDPLDNSLDRWSTVRDAIADLSEPTGTEISGDAPLNLHFKRKPTELSKKRYKLIPPGGNRFDLARLAPELTPQCWIKKKKGGSDIFGRLWWDRPSVTIRTEFFKPEKGRYLHPSKNRAITHREAARLMGFPDDFVFLGNKAQIARQIGNAVPPQLAGAIARSILMLFSHKVSKGV